MNIQQMMKQAQQMQKKVAAVQEQIAAAEFEGSSASGKVKVVISGKGDMKSIKIDPALIDPEDAEMLEDLVVAAFNNAKKEADTAANDAMSGAMGGMGLPAGMKLPF